MGSIETLILQNYHKPFIIIKILLFNKGILEENQITKHNNRLVVTLKINVIYGLVKENSQVSSDRCLKEEWLSTRTAHGEAQLY